MSGLRIERTFETLIAKKAKNCLFESGTDLATKMKTKTFVSSILDFLH